MAKKNSAKYFDYGTGSAPVFKRKPRRKAIGPKKPRDRKAAARKAAATRASRKFNKNFDYGVGSNPIAAAGKPVCDAAKKLAKAIFGTSLARKLVP